MAGHRRVSGRCVCPDDANNMEPTTPSPRRSVRLGSCPPEQQTPQPPSPARPEPTNQDPRSRHESAKPKRALSMTPRITIGGYYKTEDESYYTKKDPVDPPAPPQRRASRIEPTSSFNTFIQGVGLNTPLASLFTAPKSDIDEVQEEAGKHGLYTGTVYKPRKIKEEESQRWVVLGRDSDAVDRLVDFQRMDVARQLELESPTTTTVPTTAQPVNVVCSGLGIWRMFIAFLPAVIIGGVTLFYMYVYDSTSYY